MKVIVVAGLAAWFTLGLIAAALWSAIRSTSWECPECCRDEFHCICWVTVQEEE